MAELTLHDLLEKDLQNTVDLQSLLRAERTQLEARDIGALSRTLIEKAELLAAIEQNDEARRKLLVLHGYPLDNKGMRRFCAESPQRRNTLRSTTGTDCPMCSPDQHQRRHCASQQAEYPTRARYTARQRDTIQPLHQRWRHAQDQRNKSIGKSLTKTRSINGE